MDRMMDPAVGNATTTGRNRGKGRTGRLQIVMPERSVDRLEHIMEVTDASSLSEVIRRALRIYEGLLEETQDGARLIIERPDGSREELPIGRVI